MKGLQGFGSERCAAGVHRAVRGSCWWFCCVSLLPQLAPGSCPCCCAAFDGKRVNEKVRSSAAVWHRQTVCQHLQGI